MKRIRSEQISSVVNHYLKRRHYITKDDDMKWQKSDRRMVYKVHQMALLGTAHSNTGVGNAVSFSSISGDVTASDQQYTRLKQFVNDSAECMREQLLPVLYPMFLHVYLELLCNGQKTPAHKFYSRHHQPFLEVPSQRQNLEQMVNMFTREDMEENKAITQFRKNKYMIEMRRNAVQHLFRFLKKEDNVLMLQIFNSYIAVKVRDKDDNQNLELHEDSTVTMDTPASPFTPENKVIHSEVTLSSLQKAIRNVRDGPATLTSVCLYSVNPGGHGLSSVRISSDQSLLCTGCEDSSIYLWSLAPEPHPGWSAPLPGGSTVRLAGDQHVGRDEDSQSSVSRDSVVLRGHSGAVYKTSFMNENTHLLSASEDTSVRLWDTERAESLVSYLGHIGPVWDVHNSYGADYFASCSRDRTVRLWCTDRRYPVRSFIGHVSDVDCVQFHPNNNYVASGSADKTVRLWSLQTGRCVRLLQGHRGGVLALAFSQNGQYLASAGEDRRVKLWDLSNGKLMRDLRGHTDTVHALSFNRENTMLVSGGVDGTIRSWDVCNKSSNAAPNSTLSDSNTCSELLGQFPTKCSSIQHLYYAPRNLLLAAGASSS